MAERLFTLACQAALVVGLIALALLGLAYTLHEGRPDQAYPNEPGQPGYESPVRWSQVGK